ncbi:MAG: zinc-ribbon domain-containing protein [Clostridia bacterium]|nr:zinc-ribbon domain-containing protein [Clostridia bacterium]
MADKTLVCKDCNNEFVFTEGEQAFYQEKGFENEPQRCPDCRKARKAQRNNNRGGFGGGNRNGGGRSFGGGNRW